MASEWLDFALFARASALGSLSAAGRELGLSPASASARLAGLERELGARLLHRTTRRTRLTEDGAGFLPHAQEVLAAVEAARASVGAGAVEPRGTLRATAPASFGRPHVVPALVELMRRHPHLRVDLRLSDSVVDLVEEAVDVAIRVAEVPGPPSVVARRLAPDRRVLVAAPSYLERHGAPRTPEELEAHNCLVLHDQRVWPLHGPGGPRAVRVGGSLRTNNGDALREAAVAGLGIALKSTWNVGEQLRRGELVRVLPGFPVASEHAVWAVYPAARLVTPKVRAFVDHFARRFAGTPYWDAGLAAWPAPPGTTREAGRG